MSALGSPVTPVRKAKPLWGVRTPLPTSTSRALSVGALAFSLGAWCVLSIDFFGHGALVPPLYLPSPVGVLKGLVQLTVDQGLAGSLLTSIRRVSIAFGLCIV